MEVVPCATLLTSPDALMVAVVETVELQVTDAVMSSVPAANFPLAEYCCALPSGRVALTGETVMVVRPVALPVPVRLIRPGLPNAV